jgi:dihydroxy-acid dehydratase
MAPEAAVGGGLALLRTGDRIRVDLNQRTVTALVDETEMERRKLEPPYQAPESQTPWQELYRQLVGQLSTGGCLEPATLYLKVVETRGDPRHSH